MKTEKQLKKTESVASEHKHKKLKRATIPSSKGKKHVYLTLPTMFHMELRWNSQYLNHINDFYKVTNNTSIIDMD